MCAFHMVQSHGYSIEQHGSAPAPQKREMIGNAVEIACHFHFDARHIGKCHEESLVIDRGTSTKSPVTLKVASGWVESRASSCDANKATDNMVKVMIAGGRRDRRISD